MIKNRDLGILLALLLVSTLAEEDSEPSFKAPGAELEMGFCFGGHITLYRSTAEGKQLLGQSSSSVSPPAAFKDRINITNLAEGLVSLKIMNLQFSDSGIYIIECTSDNVTKNYHKRYVHVCNEEVRSEEISLTPDTGADLVCKIGSNKQAKMTIKWYRDDSNTFLFLDTKTSLEPLQEELKGLIQVRDKGSSLHVSDELLKDRPRFICLVMEGEKCRSFQYIDLPEEPEMKSIYRSVGDNMVLTCTVDQQRQNYWETPVGRIDSSSLVSVKELGTKSTMSVTNINRGDYSLVINNLTPNHTGSYRCFSGLLVEEYIVNVCPVFESADVLISSRDEKVTLKCSFMTLPEFSGKKIVTSVQWYRNIGEEDELINDSGDPLVSTPDDFIGRVNVSQLDSSLVITNPTVQDTGTYWCVVLLDNDDGGNEKDDSEEEYDLVMDENDEVKEEHELFIEEDYMDMCLFRQVTNLKIHSNPRHFTVAPPEPTAEPESSLTLYAVYAGVIALVVLGLIGAVVGLIIRAKKKASNSQRGDLELSEEEKALRSN